MIRVRITPDAHSDLTRLAEWLQPKSAHAADSAAAALAKAIDSLREMPGRGRPIGRDVRELPVRFGRYGYVVRYRLTKDEVVVSGVRHVREDR